MSSSGRSSSPGVSEAMQRSLSQLDACLAFGLREGGVLLEVKGPDEQGERHALADQSCDDHGKAQIDDVVAARERVPGLGGGRHRQQRGQGDGPPHSRPTEDQPFSPAGRIGRLMASAWRSDHPRERPHPDHPYHDDRRNHGDSSQGQAPEGAAGLDGEGVEGQSHQYEQGGIDQEHEGLPERVGLQSAASRKGAAAVVPTQVEAGGHRGQDPGGVDLLGRQVGHVGEKDRTGDLHRRIVDPVSDQRPTNPTANPMAAPTTVAYTMLPKV